MTARPLIIGADLSSQSLALVAKHPVTPTQAVVKYDIRESSGAKFSSYNCGEALGSMYEYLDSVAPMAIPGSPRLAFIEAAQVAGARNLQSTIKQAYVNGVVQAAFVQAGFTVHLVPVSTWKKVVVGNGNATKEDVARCVRGRWPVVANHASGDQDIIDAAAVCLYGQEWARQVFGP